MGRLHRLQSAGVRRPRAPRERPDALRVRAAALPAAGVWRPGRCAHNYVTRGRLQQPEGAMNFSEKKFFRKIHGSRVDYAVFRGSQKIFRKKVPAWRLGLPREPRIIPKKIYPR